jgi:hypothetical protein
MNVPRMAKVTIAPKFAKNGFGDKLNPDWNIIGGNRNKKKNSSWKLNHVLQIRGNTASFNRTC